MPNGKITTKTNNKKSAPRKSISAKYKELQNLHTQLQTEKATLENNQSELVKDIQLIAEQVKILASKGSWAGKFNVMWLITNSGSIIRFIKEVIKIVKEKGYIPANAA